MKTTVRFDRQYDVARLQADFATAEAAGQAHLHWSDYHDGGWSAIPLVSLNGQTDIKGLRYGRGVFEKTPILAQCPYFEEIIDSFKCPKHRIRLMRLKAGTVIREHCDPGDTWALGQIRLHIPVVTHEEVHFYLNGERVMMREGELWYLDFSKPHHIENRSPIDRIHFVLDLVVNRWMRDFFPPETSTERLANWVYWGRFQGTETLHTAARKCGLGAVRRQLKRMIPARQPS